MTPYKEAEEAMHKLVLATIKKSNREIIKWRNRVEYWAEVVHDFELKGGSMTKTDVVKKVAEEKNIEIIDHRIIDPYNDYSITQKIEFLVGHGYGSGEELLDYLEGRDVGEDMALNIVKTLRYIIAKEGVNNDTSKGL